LRLSDVALLKYRGALKRAAQDDEQGAALFIVPINDDPFYAIESVCSLSILTFLAFSSPAFFLVPHFHVSHFQSPRSTADRERS